MGKFPKFKFKKAFVVDELFRSDRRATLAELKRAQKRAKELHVEKSMKHDFEDAHYWLGVEQTLNYMITDRQMHGDKLGR